LKSYVIENKNYKTLNILSLGHQACPPSHTFSYAFTDFYLIHYVVSGCGAFIKNGEEKKVKKGEIFIIKPNNIYTYIADNENPWEYIWFSFNGEVASKFDVLDDVVAVQGNIICEMLEAENLETTRTEFLTGKLYEFMSQLFESTSKMSNYTKRAADFIKANYMHKLYVADIARELNLNARYLSRIFKKEMGVSPQEYCISYKMQKASELLQRKMSVSETAKLVGYDDVFTFSKIFKKHTGISPSKYKKQVD